MYRQLNLYFKLIYIYINIYIYIYIKTAVILLVIEDKIYL